MNSISPTIKGIIAIMITLLVVIIVIMFFVKSLFINDSSKPKKTGTITSTEYVPTETTTTTEEAKETKKKKTTAEEEDPNTNSDDGDAVGEITCTGPVYLHPEPNSSSANLTTIPQGAVCKFFKDENGWYYVEYEGQKGYAWRDFFTAPPSAQ
ncbi:MAG: SH3 domain-containing protein [Ruminococcus sp.]|nr:SH3 domain-containing protein [Ruminococcus sp.]